MLQIVKFFSISFIALDLFCNIVHFLYSGSREASFRNGCFQGFSGKDRQADGHCQLPDIEGQQ